MKRFIILFGALALAAAPSLALADDTATATSTSTSTATSSSTATGGAATATGGAGGSSVIQKGAITNINTVSPNIHPSNTQGQSQNNKQTIAPSQSVNVQAADIPAQAPVVFVPNLTAVPETCMGSTSAGGSAGFAGTGFGLSFGTTWKSDACELRMFARSLQSLGPKYEAAAIALLAQNDNVRAALQAAGVKVAGVAEPAPVAAAVPASTTGGVVEKKDVSMTPAGPPCGDGRPVKLTSSGWYSCAYNR